MKQRKIGRILLLAFLWMWICTSTVYAEITSVDAIFVEEDEDKGFHMVCGGIGGFSSNVKPGETAQVVVINLDEGLEGELYLDDKEQDFANDKVLYANGSYELRIYRGSTRENVPYGRFCFNIQNTYEEDLAGQEGGFELVKNPEMEITQEKGSGYYHYELPNKSSFTLSVPSGAVSTGPVWMTLSDNISILKAQHNEKSVYQLDSMIFEEEGTYHLTLFSTGSSSALEGYSSVGAGNFQVEVYFKIGPKVTNSLDFINTPQGFRIGSIRCDGREITGKGTTRYLERDGSYQIRFLGENDPSVTYELAFELDRRAPYLTFSKDVTKKLVAPPVTVKASEPGSTIQAAHSGNISELEELELYDGGYYQLIVEDPAGNTRSYSVTLKYPSGLPFGGVLPLLVILAVLVGVWMRYLRDHVQIR